VLSGHSKIQKRQWKDEAALSAGIVFFRLARKIALITISNTRAIAQAAIVLPAFGLPAIMTAGEMPVRSASFSLIQYFEKEKKKEPSCDFRKNHWYIPQTNDRGTSFGIRTIGSNRGASNFQNGYCMAL